MTRLHRSTSAFFSSLFLVFAQVACRSDLPLDDPFAAPTGSAAPPEAPLSITLEPKTSLTSAPAVLRVHVAPKEGLSQERLKLVRGKVGSSQLGQIARDEISKSLEARLVPNLMWTDAEGSIVIAPSVPLLPAETYAVASGDFRVAVPFVVEAKSKTHRLDRIWPPPDQAGTSQLGVFCGQHDFFGEPLWVPLSPDGPSGLLTAALGQGAASGHCLRFELAEPAPAAPFVLPPEVTLKSKAHDGERLALDPRPFLIDADLPEPLVPLECSDEEVVFGPGCVVVMDDRLFVRSPKAPLLWGIAGETLDLVKTTKATEPFVMKGLPSASEITLDVLTFDVFGHALRQTFTTSTLSPLSHIVLNEVLANPLGPEPHQEWVELYNDGAVPGSLDGYTIADIGGKTLLPEVTLEPGQFALVVNETFEMVDEVDVTPPEDVLLVRVPTLGKSGLSNAGEPLRLLDKQGLVISRFPAIPKPKAGQSLARVVPDAPDGVSASFVVAQPTPGGTNAPLQ